MISYSTLIRTFGPYGLYYLANRITHEYPRVLMYHRFSEHKHAGFIDREKFEKQIKYLKTNFEIISLSEVALGGIEHEKCNKPRVAITVDDGYRDFYEVAYPVLQKYNVPATFFVTTGFIDGQCWLWQDRVKWCITHGSIKGKIQVGNIMIEESEWHFEKGNAWRRIVSELLKKPGKEIEYCLSELADNLGVSIPIEVPDRYAPVSWEQLREMADNGIEVGGHTVNHYSLGRLAHSEATSEVNDCSQRLEEELGPRERPFCYPNGQPADIPRQYRKLLSGGGFNSSVVAFYDRFRATDIYAIRRHGVGDNWFAFLKSVNGIDWLGAVLLGRNSVFDWGDNDG